MQLGWDPLTDVVDPVNAGGIKIAVGKNILALIQQNHSARHFEIETYLFGERCQCHIQIN